MPTALRLAAAGLLLAALVACSSDEPADVDPGPSGPTPSGSATSGTVEEDDVRAALAAVFTGEDGAGTDEADGACFADALLERVEADALVAAGVVGGDGRAPDALPVLDPGLAGQWVDAQTACVDFVTASTGALTAQSKGRLDGAAYSRCLRGALTPAERRAAQVQALSGGMASPEVATLAEAQRTCATRALPVD